MNDKGAVTTSAARTVTVEGTAVAGNVYYIHSDHLDTPREITNEQNQTVWKNPPLTEPFGMTPVDEDPDGDGQVFTFNLRFPGQYYDQETGVHYNYFRDNYLPDFGRYGQSDPIGLEGGINTYAYVGGNPLIAIDPLGLMEICKRLIEQEWRELGRGWKIVDYKYRRSIDRPLDVLMNAITTIKPGFGAIQMIPVMRDLALEQLIEIHVEICYDDCTKTTVRRVLFEQPQKEFRENWYNPYLGDREGDPVWRTTADIPPSFQTRWGR
jgi:RHS repeat-associated protein